MVDIVSLLIGVSFVLGFMIVGGSYMAAYLYGTRVVSESGHYVNTRDVERYRRESVRHEELLNTEASVTNERPEPHSEE